ncbi:MAG: PHP domain-containing protein [Chloroflexi bacterium]|uniref:PHP domain-containing protein n=1 Tax=Candidatus Chlorohelix allophototropha TaxID=3003348 RepID=A0A8T7M5G1_9CHLR|nr:PHP domain-containing protein [Chloroflexota bacterium]WJW69282.1 PHP domain-containing protein [Chloroflexota bacterium L227-S17]
MQLQTKMPGLGVDFHMHTLASDGLWTPHTLVETAAAQGVRIITVTDHDTIGNVEPVRLKAQAQGIGFVPGLELTVGWKDSNYHLLMFNFDSSNPHLNALLEDTQYRVLQKKERILNYLYKLGYKLHGLDQVRRPDGDFMIYDIPRALVRGDEVQSYDHAYSVCMGGGFDEIINQPAELGFEIGNMAGAVMVLAHPGRSDPGISYASDHVLDEFVEMGLAGVEAYHYSHGGDAIERLVRFARKRDLAISCGSDSHNEARKPMPWNPELCRSLLERLDIDISEVAA